jgi:hypothetical protein
VLLLCNSTSLNSGGTNDNELVHQIHPERTARECDKCRGSAHFRIGHS